MSSIDRQLLSGDSAIALAMASFAAANSGKNTGLFDYYAELYKQQQEAMVS